MRAKTKAQAKLKDKKTARPKSFAPKAKQGGGFTTGVRAACPECDTRITLPSKPRLDMDIVCHDCDSNLQLVSLSPPELDYAA